MAGRKTVLRVCASCEWIFKGGDFAVSCPKCSFGSYGAKSVFGKKCYRYAKTQQPWIDKKVTECTIKLIKEVENEIS